MIYKYFLFVIVVVVVVVVIVVFVVDLRNRPLQFGQNRVGNS